MAKVLSVSEFVEAIRGLLRETIGSVTVQGEVTNYRTRRDELVYFELKDAHSRVLCFGLRHEVRQALEDGMELRVTGSPSLFKGSGGFHLRVVAIELVGAGALRKAFELLRRRLEAEGLFRPERKRPLPDFPESVGLITSPDAAAYADVRRVLHDRWPLVRLKLAAVAVQGAGAARQIERALEHFSASGQVDVVILTRGGGSLEDLQAFNDELVARALYGCRVPVVVGVGHERDLTIADLVADRRAATPSNAAELVAPDRIEVLRRMEVMAGRLHRALAASLEAERGRLRETTRRLGVSLERRATAIRFALERFGNAGLVLSHRMAAFQAGLARLAAVADHRLRTLLATVRSAVDRLGSLLQTLSPLGILKRGYSLTTTADGRIVHRSTDLKVGDRIRTRFRQGEAGSKVTEVA